MTLQRVNFTKTHTLLNIRYENAFENNLKRTLPAGFEPTRGDPIGFQVQRLNHSAKAACPPTGNCR